MTTRRYVDIVGVTGSIPVLPTTQFPTVSALRDVSHKGPAFLAIVGLSLRNSRDWHSPPGIGRIAPSSLLAFFMSMILGDDASFRRCAQTMGLVSGAKILLPGSAASVVRRPVRKVHIQAAHSESLQHLEAAHEHSLAIHRHGLAHVLERRFFPHRLHRLVAVFS